MPFLLLSGKFPHVENCIEHIWVFPYGVRTDCVSGFSNSMTVFLWRFAKSWLRIVIERAPTTAAKLSMSDYGLFLPIAPHQCYWVHCTMLRSLYGFDRCLKVFSLFETPCTSLQNAPQKPTKRDQILNAYLISSTVGLPVVLFASSSLKLVKSWRVADVIMRGGYTCILTFSALAFTEQWF